MKPDRETWIQILRDMTPAEKIRMVDRMTEDAKQQLRDELRKRFPHLTEKQLHQLFLKRWFQMGVEDR